MKKLSPALWVAQGAIIAALYVVLTYFIAAFNLANGAIQFRISEALCILPIFTPAAIPGVTLGCLISNIITGCSIFDIIFGTLATLIGAFGTYFLRKTKFISTLPPVLSNMIIIPLLLKYAYGLDDAWWWLVITVGAGEILSICGLGMLLKAALWKFRNQIFRFDVAPSPAK